MNFTKCTFFAVLRFCYAFQMPTEACACPYTWGLRSFLSQTAQELSRQKTLMEREENIGASKTILIGEVSAEAIGCAGTLKGGRMHRIHFYVLRGNSGKKHYGSIGIK